MIWLFLYAVPLFLAAGTAVWWNAIAYVVVNLVSIAFINAVVYKDSADLAQERASARAGAKTWDKVLVPFVVAVLPLASNILAGLDKRFSWTTTVTVFESLLAFGVFLVASGLIAWSMRSNLFFSSHVRIQTERGHSVVSSGPYAFVRHPGYVGMILGSLAGPVLLGSVISLWVGITNGCLIILRTWLEDRTLQAELPGYGAYAAKVRYRLIPLIW